jgi:Transglutaminase-like superfamily
MRLLFWKALLGLFAYDLLLLNRDFARLLRIVRSRAVAAKYPPAGITAQVCGAIDHACTWYPKHALCLQRSAVTTCLLRRYGVSAQMVFGAQKLPFSAHAWVEVDGCPVNERIDVQAIYGVWERC